MDKYYVYDNASRRLKSGKFTYSFDVVEQFGGSWRGVLHLTDAAQITTLESFGPRMGVKEIPKEDYDALLKKKLNSPRSSPDIIRLPVSPLKEVAGRVVLKDPSNPTTLKVEAIAQNSKPTIEEAVSIGTAPYIDPLEQRSNGKRKKKATA